MFAFSQRSKDRLAGVDPRLIETLERALQISPVDFGIGEHGGVRTAMEQNQLYRLGRSKADGYVKKSKHQSGRAADVFAAVKGREYDELLLTTIAAAVLQAANELGHRVEWGGLWAGFVDMPYFQISDKTWPTQDTKKKSDASTTSWTSKVRNWF